MDELLKPVIWLFLMILVVHGQLDDCILKNYAKSLTVEKPHWIEVE